MSDTEREGVTFACEDCGSRVEDAPMRPATCVECGGAFEVVHEDDDVDLPLLLRSVDRGDEVRLRKGDGSFVRGDVRRVWHEADEDEVRLTLSGDGQASYEVRADAGDKLAEVTVTKVMGSGESAVRAGRDRVVGALNPVDHPDAFADHRGERVALVGCGQKKASHPVPARQLYESAYFDKKHRYAEQDDVDAWFILSAEYGFVHPDERIEPYDTHIDDVDADEWCALVQEQMPHLVGSTVEVLAGEAYFEALDLALDFAVGTDGMVERPLEGLGIGEQMAWLKEHTGEDPDEAVDDPGADGVSELTEDDFPSVEDLDAHGDPVHCGTCKRNLPGDPVLEVECPVCGAEKGEKCSRPSGHSGNYVHPHGKRDRLALAKGITPPCPEGMDPMTPEEAAEALGIECEVDETDPFDYEWPWFVDGVLDAENGITTGEIDMEGGRAHHIAADGRGAETTDQPEQTDDTNFECEGCGHRDRLNSDVDVRRQSCVECGGDMILDGADVDTTEQATLAPEPDDDLQEERDDAPDKTGADDDGCVAIIDTTGEPCGNSVTTEASDTSALFCGTHAKASSVSRTDAAEGEPDPDLRDRLVEAGMNGSHAYYLATLTDSAEMLWHIVTDCSEIGGGEVTYEPSTLATLAPTVAQLEDVDAEGHPLAYDGCVAVIDVGARGKDYRCGSGGYANKLLCGTHQDTNAENLRTVFDADAPEDLRIDEWPEIGIGDDRFLAVEQRDGDLLAISMPEYEYRRLEGFGYLVDELEDAGDVREDEEGNQSLTDDRAGDVQEPNSEEIEAEAKADDTGEDEQEGQTWVEITDDGTDEHTSTAPEPAFLNDHPEESLVRVELEDGRVYTGEVVDHGAGGWRNDARSLYIEADAVRGSLMVYCNRQDDGSWGDLQALDKLIGAYDDPDAGEDALGAVASIEQIVDEPDRDGVLEELVPLLEAGLSPSQALDYWATEGAEATHGAFTQQEWAGIRDVSRQAVGGNAAKARDALAEEE